MSIINTSTPSVPGPSPAMLMKAAEVIKSEIADKPKTRYVLFYMSGNNTSTNFKFFDFDGNLTQAIQRSKDHCSTLNLRFIRVKPFISDLDLEETLHTTNR